MRAFWLIFWGASFLPAHTGPCPDVILACKVIFLGQKNTVGISSEGMMNDSNRCVESPEASRQSQDKCRKVFMGHPDETFSGKNPKEDFEKQYPDAIIFPNTVTEYSLNVVAAQARGVIRDVFKAGFQLITGGQPKETDNTAQTV